jgi:hypothetical protein
MAGILAVAEVPGFLKNLDEMLEAADAEGAVWRAFVARWWEAHQSNPVGVGDLYKVSLVSEPPMPLGDGSERSQKTRLGKALGRMRDRIYQVVDALLSAGLKCVCAAGEFARPPFGRAVKRHLKCRSPSTPPFGELSRISTRFCSARSRFIDNSFRRSASHLRIVRSAPGGKLPAILD